MIPEIYTEGDQFVRDKQRWHEGVERAIPEAIATGQAVSLFLIDVNNFKLINDELGHLDGDDAIIQIRRLVGQVASQVRKEARDGQRDLVSAPSTSEYDDPVTDPDSLTSWLDYVNGQDEEAITVGHIGGDEVGILAFTDAAGAAAITKRLREAFGSFIDHPANAQLKELEVGMAIGSATFDLLNAPEDMEGKEAVSSLLRAADEAMYDDKLRQLPDLTPEQLQSFNEARQKLKDAGVRPRQFLNYLRKYFDQEVELVE